MVTDNNNVTATSTKNITIEEPAKPIVEPTYMVVAVLLVMFAVIAALIVVHRLRKKREDAIDIESGEDEESKPVKPMKTKPAASKASGKGKTAIQKGDKAPPTKGKLPPKAATKVKDFSMGRQKKRGTVKQTALRVWTRILEDHHVVPGKDGVPHVVERRTSRRIGETRRSIAEHPALQPSRKQSKRIHPPIRLSRRSSSPVRALRQSGRPCRRLAQECRPVRRRRSS